MTKKDFIALANMIKDADDLEYFNGAYGKNSFAESLADYCATKNPRFNRSTFLDACGVSDD